MAAFVPIVFVGLILVGLFVVAMMQLMGGKEDPGHKGDAHRTAEEDELHKQMKPAPKIQPEAQPQPDEDEN